MNEKYLPIGSIITTKKSSQKIMIVGYFGLEYTEAIEVYDYMGCTYPKGLLEKNNMIFFNHEDIITCDFVGYKDSSYTDLNKKLINGIKCYKEHGLKYTLFRILDKIKN